MLRFAACAALLLVATGCPGPDPIEPSADFPADFPAAFREARTPCTLSHDHELRYIRVYADDAAYEAYRQQDRPYPVGARLLKVEYDDEACTELLDYVLMERLETGSRPEELDWEWRRFDALRRDIVDRRRIPATCIDCHDWHCARPPYGWDYTCPEGGMEPPPR